MMKFNHNKLIFGTLVLMVSVAGCKWNDEQYQDYVTVAGQVVSCPPELNFDDSFNMYIQLEHLKCYDNQVDPVDAEIHYPEEYRLCRNYQKFWNRRNENIAFVGGLDAFFYPDAKKYSVCPSEYSTCSFDEDRNSWGCIDCLPGYAKCKNACINPLTDSDYCGADIACENYTKCNDNELCIGGRCVLNNCSNGMNLCGENDCRFVRGNDKDNCGDCRYRCEEHETATAKSDMCTSGICMYQCKDGYTYCGGGSTANSIICIANERFKNDTNNCGRCGNKCSSQQVCIDGNCLLNNCSLGMMLCALDDCRNILGDDVNNCGACDYKCNEHPLPHATSNACLEGKCIYQCEPGYYNIGDEYVPNCINPLIDQHHCAKTDGLIIQPVDCGVNPCVNGECIKTVCEHSNQTLCPPNPISGSSMPYCADLSSDENNCGFCGYACPETNGPNTILSGCNNSKCVYACDSLRARNCPVNGSNRLNCVDLSIDSENCGECGNRCGNNQYCFGRVCQDSSCSETCQSSGSSNCSQNGCPSVTCHNVTEYCGPSCIDCVQTAHGESGYTSCDFENGVCNISKCQYGYHMVRDTSGIVRCELNSDLACGSRDKIDVSQCRDFFSCSDGEGRCVLQCSNGTHPNATNTGCENDSIIACGSYNNNCYTTGVSAVDCVSGTCIVSCNPGYHKVVASGSGQETCAVNTLSECGDAMINCLEPQYHAVDATCNGFTGKCDLTNCESGYHYVRKAAVSDECDTFVCLHNEYTACELNSQTSCGLRNNENVENCNDYADGEGVSYCDNLYGRCSCIDPDQEICREFDDPEYKCRDLCESYYKLY